jgi:hypothetical protein
MVCWPGVVAERWATWPALVASSPRCIRSSSRRVLRQVSPVGVLDHSQEQQREPAQLDMGADAVLAVVEHRAQPQGAFEVAPAAFDGEELFVGGGEIIGGQRGVGGAQQPLAVQVRLALDRAVVDAQQAGLVYPHYKLRGRASHMARPRRGMRKIVRSGLYAEVDQQPGDGRTGGTSQGEAFAAG